MDLTMTTSAQICDLNNQFQTMCYPHHPDVNPDDNEEAQKFQVRLITCLVTTLQGAVPRSLTTSSTLLHKHIRVLYHRGPYFNTVPCTGIARSMRTKHHHSLLGSFLYVVLLTQPKYPSACSAALLFADFFELPTPLPTTCLPTARI